MARTFSRAAQTYPAGDYGPFVIDGKFVGDAGARITLTRGPSGSWPLTPQDTVATVLIEGLYGTQWMPLAKSTFAGGVLTDNFGATKLDEHFSILWPQVRVGDSLVPDPPDAVRFSANIAAPLNTALDMQWVS